MVGDPPAGGHDLDGPELYGAYESQSVDMGSGLHVFEAYPRFGVHHAYAQTYTSYSEGAPDVAEPPGSGSWSGLDRSE